MLDLQHINSNMYFEFYLNDSFFYRYNLDCEELDISMRDLSYYLTTWLFKQYQYKKITGHSYHAHSIVRLYVLIDLHPTTADIEQSEELSRQFPLDFHLSEKEFAQHLYTVLLLLTFGLAGWESFLAETEIVGIPLLNCSGNIFWKLFPDYGTALDTHLDQLLEQHCRSLAKCQAENEKGKQRAAVLVANLSETMNDLQEESTSVLHCYDDILDQYGRYTRKQRYLPAEKSFANSAHHGQLTLHEKTRAFMHYFQGKFASLDRQQLSICNKYMAWLLFLPNRDNYELAKERELSLHRQVNEMLDSKNRLINQLNDMQQQAIQIWQQ